MKALLEMIQALNKVTPGIASEHTLFYGVEAKLYSARPGSLAASRRPLQGYTPLATAQVSHAAWPGLRFRNPRQACLRYDARFLLNQPFPEPLPTLTQR